MDLEIKIKELSKKEYKFEKDKRIIDILKAVIVDKIIDADKLVFATSTTEETIKKYIEEEELFKDFLTHKEFVIFKNKLKTIFNKTKTEEEEKDIYLLGKVFDEILNTRHKLEDICRNNGYSLSRFKTTINLGDYIDRNFGKNMQKRIKNKITQNGIARDSVPRKMILIEEKEDIMVVKPEIYYLNEFDYKKISFVSAYLLSNANIEFVAKKYGVNVITALNVLDDSKLESIIKESCYEKLVRYVALEKTLLGSSIKEKTKILTDVIKILYANNFDVNIVVEQLKITYNLLEKMLKEISKNLYFDESIRNDIKSLLTPEENKKVK